MFPKLGLLDACADLVATRDVPWCADRVDLWVRDRGYSDGVQDALSGLALHLLHATPASIQGLRAHQFVRSVEPSAAVGSWFRGNFAQSALPTVVWLWRRQKRRLEMPGKTGVHQHHYLPAHLLALAGILCASCRLFAHWKIYYPHGKNLKPLPFNGLNLKFLPFKLDISISAY